MSGAILRSPVPVDVVVEETDIGGNIECGFRAECFEGTIDDVGVMCTTGGGCGSPWVTLTVGGRYFRIDLREVAKSLVAFVSSGESEGLPVGGAR